MFNPRRTIRSIRWWPYYVGAVTNGMTLTVIVTPNISGLNNQAVSTGSTVTIPATISGVPTPTTRWQFDGYSLSDGVTGNGSTISGSTTGTLGIANAQAADSGTYSLIASNNAGIVTNSTTLTVSSGNVAPIITGPADQTVVQTSTADIQCVGFPFAVAHLAMAGERHRPSGSDQFLADCFQCPIFTERLCVFTGGRQRRRHGDEQRQSVRSRAADHFATTDQPHGGDRQSASFQRRCERRADGEIPMEQERQPNRQRHQRVLQHRQCARCG